MTPSWFAKKKNGTSCSFRVKRAGRRVWRAADGAFFDAYVTLVYVNGERPRCAAADAVAVDAEMAGGRIEVSRECTYAVNDVLEKHFDIDLSTIAFPSGELLWR